MRKSVLCLCFCVLSIVFLAIQGVLANAATVLANEYPDVTRLRGKAIVCIDCESGLFSNASYGILECGHVNCNPCCDPDCDPCSPECGNEISNCAGDECIVTAWFFAMCEKTTGPNPIPCPTASDPTAIKKIWVHYTLEDEETVPCGPHAWEDPVNQPTLNACMIGAAGAAICQVDAIYSSTCQEGSMTSGIQYLREDCV